MIRYNLLISKTMKNQTTCLLVLFEESQIIKLNGKLNNKNAYCADCALNEYAINNYCKDALISYLMNLCNTVHFKSEYFLYV